jgi:hypothetical protein
MKAQKTAFKVAKSADLKAPRKIETPTHLSVNKIQQAARLRGYVIAPPKLIAALDKEGYEVMVVPSPSRSGFTRFYKAPDVAAWLDKVAPTKTEAAAPSSAVAGATPHMLHELRELRSEVGVLKDAIHALMTSVMESRDHIEAIHSVLNSDAERASARHAELTETLDTIDTNVTVIKQQEQDEKTTLDNVLEILTRPAPQATSAASAPALGGIDSVLDTHDD